MERPDAGEVVRRARPIRRLATARAARLGELYELMERAFAGLPRLSGWPGFR